MEKKFYNSLGEELNYEKSEKIKERQLRYDQRKKFEKMGFNFKSYPEEIQNHLLNEIVSLYDLISKKSFIDNNVKKIYKKSKEEYFEFSKRISDQPRKEIENEIREILDDSVEENKLKKIGKIVEGTKELEELETLLECIYRSIFRSLIEEKYCYTQEEEIIVYVNDQLNNLLEDFKDRKNYFITSINKQIIECKNYEEFNLQSFQMIVNKLCSILKNDENILKMANLKEITPILKILLDMSYIETAVIYILNIFNYIYLDNDIFKKNRKEIYIIFSEKMEKYIKNTNKRTSVNIIKENPIFDLVHFLELRKLYAKYQLKCELLEEWNKKLDILFFEKLDELKNISLKSEKINIFELKVSDFKGKGSEDNHHKEKMERLDYLYERLNTSYFLLEIPQNIEFIKKLYKLIFEELIKINDLDRTVSVNTILKNKLQNKYSSEYLENFLLVLLEKIKFNEEEQEIFNKVQKKCLKVIESLFRAGRRIEIKDIQDFIQTLVEIEEEIGNRYLKNSNY